MTIRPEDIVAAVAAEHGLDPEALSTASRRGPIAQARAEAIWLIRTLSKRSFADCGQALGIRLSSAHYAYAMVETRRAHAPEVRARLERLTKALGNGRNSPAVAARAVAALDLLKPLHAALERIERKVEELAERLAGMDPRPPAPSAEPGQAPSSKPASDSTARGADESRYMLVAACAPVPVCPQPPRTLVPPSPPARPIEPRSEGHRAAVALRALPPREPAPPSGRPTAERAAALLRRRGFAVYPAREGLWRVEGDLLDGEALIDKALRRAQLDGVPL